MVRLLVAIVAALAFPAAAQASDFVNVTAPTGTVSGCTAFTATYGVNSGDTLTSVDFQVDGVTVQTDTTPPYAVTPCLDTTAYSNGSHTFKARGHFTIGGLKQSSNTATISNGNDNTPYPGWWSSSFENGQSLPTEWSFWGQGQENLYGCFGTGCPNRIGTAASFGIPNSPDGTTHVVSLYHAANDPAVHHKLYKAWTSNWPAGGEPRPDVQVTPDDPSGRYITHVYIPSANLDFPCCGTGTGIAQFKEAYLNQNGDYHSIPSYWLVIKSADDGSGGFWIQPSCWYMDSGCTKPPISATPYLDRWVKVELRLYNHDRLEIYLDDQLKFTETNDVWGGDSDPNVGRPYSVGRRWYIGHHGDIDGEDPGGIVSANLGWTYGVGNYVFDTRVNSTEYFDDTVVKPLCTAPPTPTC